MRSLLPRRRHCHFARRPADARAQFQPPVGTPRKIALPAGQQSRRLRPAACPRPPPLSPEDTTRLQIFPRTREFRPRQARRQTRRVHPQSRGPLRPRRRARLTCRRPAPRCWPRCPAVREVQPFARYVVTADDLARRSARSPGTAPPRDKLKALPYTSDPRTPRRTLPLLAAISCAQLNPGRNSRPPRPRRRSCACPTSPSRSTSGRGVAVGPDGHTARAPARVSGRAW